jgi:hypothetical protein
MAGETPILGSLIGADLSGTADQEITIDSTSYVVTGVMFTDAPLLTTPENFNIWTGLGHTGVRVIAGSIAASPFADSTWFSAAPQQGRKQTSPTLQFSVPTVHGSGITGNVHVIGFDVP